jgi:hypothetical protein
MPIEIKELHIRTIINQEGSPDRQKENIRKNDSSIQTEKDEIVSECVEKVLEIIRAKKER